VKAKKRRKFVRKKLTPEQRKLVWAKPVVNAGAGFSSNAVDPIRYEKGHP